MGDERGMDKRFMVDALIDLGRLNLLIQEKDFAQEWIGKNLDMLILCLSLIEKLIKPNAFDHIMGKELEKIEAFLHHGQDYSMEKGSRLLLSKKLPVFNFFGKV
jgi:hypothetical protein